MTAVANASRFDFGSPAFLTDPWPVYAELRATEPVHWSDPAGCYVVTRFDDVSHELAGSRFTSEYPLRADRELFGPSFMNMEGAGHTQLRKVVGVMFGARAVAERVETVIRPAVREVLASVAATPELDFVARVAVPIPYAVVSRVIGIPPADWRWVFERGRPIIKALDFPRTAAREALAAEHELEAYLRDLMASASVREDSGTLLGLLANRGGLPSGAGLGTVVFLLVAGTETSICAITNMMRCVLLAPPAARPPRHDAAGIRAAARETLRWEPPTHTVLRFAGADTELRGVPIKRRSPIMFSLASANRDETVFADPDRWDWTRPPRKIMTFGAGPHTCIGLHLAQQEFEVTYDELWRRFTDIELAGPPRPIAGHSFRRPDELRLRWAPLPGREA